MEHDCLDCIYPLLWSVDEAAQELGLTSRHVTRLCRTGELIAQQVSGRWVTTPAAVAQYAAKPKNGRGKWPRSGSGSVAEDSGEGED